MTQSIVFDSQAKAAAYAAQIDTAMGYPRAGVNVGQGRHGPNVVTTQHQPIKQHPTLALWAYEDGPGVQKIATDKAIALPVGATVQVLDATWTPVVATGGAIDAQAETVP